MTHPDAQLPDRHGDVIDDIAAALSIRGDLSDEHRAFYGSVLDRFDGLTADRDRLRTAWTSARRRARSARVDLDDSISYTRQLRQQRTDLRAECRELRRALRSALSSPDEPGVHTTLSHMRKLADLPAEYMVEPGDEVSTLCELADRMHTVEQRLDAIEEHTGPEKRLAKLRNALDAIKATAPEQRTTTPRYRDTTGDLWEDQGDGTLTTIAVHRDRPGDLGITLPRAIAERQYGPLTPVTNNTAGGAE